MYKSPYVALGIWQDGRILPGDFLVSPDDKSVRILHVDDLIRQREDGLAEFVGRKDQVIKIRGQRVDLVEVEEVLRSSENIVDAVVCLREDGLHPALVAYVVTNASDRRQLMERLKAKVAARLPAYMRPAEFLLVDAIPRLPSLKPDIQALAKLEIASRGIFAKESASGMDLSKNATEPDRIRNVVEKAWTEVLDRHSFAADLEWGNAGGNSLMALRLWFLIEQALGQSLPLDVLYSSATPRELIAAIEKVVSSAPVVSASDDDKPLVFFMPGYEGDSPAFAGFRAAFEGKLRFAVARYPSWREMIEAEGRFDSIVDAVIAQVRMSGENKYLLAGYSFGGFVALEVARRLSEFGDHVKFVGLIDTQRAKVAQPPKHQNIVAKSGRMMRAMYTNSQPAYVTILQAIIRKLTGVSALPVMRAISNLAMLLPPRITFRVHLDIVAELRLRALHAMWKSDIKPLHVPVTLFRSDQYTSDSPDFGCVEVCAKLDVVSIGGSHISLIEPPYRAILCDHFLEAVSRAFGSQNHPNDGEQILQM